LEALSNCCEVVTDASKSAWSTWLTAVSWRRRGLAIQTAAASSPPVPARCICPGSRRPEQPALSTNTHSSFKRFWESRRADSNRRPAPATSDLSLVAGACLVLQIPLSEGFSFLCFTLCCAVLRSRWCQGGVRSSGASAPASFREPLPDPRHPIALCSDIGPMAASQAWRGHVSGVPKLTALYA
jgi:hypothetical protein